MGYSVINEKNKIILVFNAYDPLGKNVHYTKTIRNVLTIKQARAFARDIYSYCRIAEREYHDK